MINTRGLILLLLAAPAVLLAAGCTSSQFKSRIRQQEAERLSVPIPVQVVIVPRPGQIVPDRQDTKDIFFEFNSSELTAAAKKVVELKAGEIIDNNWDKVVIVGHTDNVGSMAFNRKLSEARAKSVADLLISLGVDSDIIQIVPASYRWPIADNTTPEGRAKNRRTDISIR